MAPLTADTLLDGHHRVEERIGDGANAVVCRTEHVLFSRQVAIELLLASSVDDRALRWRGSNEA
jgi:hypothetical protein